MDLADGAAPARGDARRRRGEAFDKVGPMLGLGYPGGPEVARLAQGGDRQPCACPRFGPKNGGRAFSFSGSRRPCSYRLRGQDALAPAPPPRIARPRGLAASFQEAVVDVLVESVARLRASARASRRCAVTGGVACNKRLRERVTRPRPRARPAWPCSRAPPTAPTTPP
jgi:N6-L-threonylcarbamoyladenine synthase